MVRFIHLADLHLGARPAYLGERADERSRDFEAAFKRAVDFACDPSNAIDLVLIAGDLFDSHNPEERLVALAESQFQRIADAGIRAVLISGTHDSYRYPDCIYRMRTFPGVDLLNDPNIAKPHTIAIRDVPVHLYGMSWDPRVSRPPYDEFKRQDLPGIHIALLHGSIKGNPEWELESRDIPLSLEQLGQTGMHYVALGHYHNFREERPGGVTVVYPGTLEGRKFGENGPKVYLELRKLFQHLYSTVLIEKRYTGGGADQFCFAEYPDPRRSYSRNRAACEAKLDFTSYSRWAERIFH